MDPVEDLDSWLEWVTLCRKEKKYVLCKNILKRLGSRIVDEHVEVPVSTSATGSRVGSSRLRAGVLTTSTITNALNSSTSGFGTTLSQNFTNPSSGLAVPFTMNPTVSGGPSSRPKGTAVRTSVRLNSDFKQNSTSNRVLFASCKYLWDTGTSVYAYECVCVSFEGVYIFFISIYKLFSKECIYEWSISVWLWLMNVFCFF